MKVRGLLEDPSKTEEFFLVVKEKFLICSSFLSKCISTSIGAQTIRQET